MKTLTKGLTLLVAAVGASSSAAESTAHALSGISLHLQQGSRLQVGEAEKLEAFEMLDEEAQSEILEKVEEGADVEWGFLKNIVNIDSFFATGPSKKGWKQKYADQAKEIQKAKEEAERKKKEDAVRKQKEVETRKVEDEQKRVHDAKMKKLEEAERMAKEKADQKLKAKKDLKAKNAAAKKASLKVKKDEILKKKEQAELKKVEKRENERKAQLAQEAKKKSQKV